MESNVRVELDFLRAEINALKGAVLRASRLADIARLAMVEHQKVFPKYRNRHNGEDLVVLASGPTLDYYNLHLNAVHLGVNRSFYAGKAKLDYLFMQDHIPTIEPDIVAYRRASCKKFFGYHYLVPGIPQVVADQARAERYYFIAGNAGYSAWDFAPDISRSPLRSYATVVHPAVQFALWTGAKTIYLVGCDTTNAGYATSLQGEGAEKNLLPVDCVKDGWRRLRDYAATAYPGTEIISINPVGLRGLFRDVYTKEYLSEHPEINDAEVIAAARGSCRRRRGKKSVRI